MTLSEIETILEELSKRHPDLSKEMLTTMLLSAGWEDRLIKDALVLFSQKHPDVSHKNNPTTKTAPLNNGAVSDVPSSEGKEKHPITELGGERVIVGSATASSPSVHVVRNQNEGGWLFRLFGITFKETRQSSNPPLSHEIKVASIQTPPLHQNPKQIIPQVASPTPLPQKTEAPVTPPVHQVITPAVPLPKIEIAAPISAPQVAPVPPVSLPVVPVQNPPSVNQTQNIIQRKEGGSWLFRLFGISLKEDKALVSTAPRQVPTLPTGKTEAPSAPREVVPAPVPAREAPRVILVETSTPPLPPPEKSLVVEIPVPVPPAIESYPAVVVPSLITREDVKLQPREIDKEALLPPNLPLVPFESSPHVWSFSEYKDTYHKDIPALDQKPLAGKGEESHVQEVGQATKEAEEDEEIFLEKTPMTKGDESLVFLASMMLFVIILILGYMYSNGRL